MTREGVFGLEAGFDGEINTFPSDLATRDDEGFCGS